MSLKLWLGTGIPISVVLFFAIFSNLDVGLQQQAEDVASIKSDKIFYYVGPNDYSYKEKEYTPVRTITFTSDYFLPRKMAVPSVAGCLYDRDGKQAAQFVNIYNGQGYGYGKSLLEVPAKGQASAAYSVYPTPIYSNETIRNYRNYDELILIEMGEGASSYYACDNINEIAKDIHGINISHVYTITITADKDSSDLASCAYPTCKAMANDDKEYCYDEGTLPPAGSTKQSWMCAKGESLSWCGTGSKCTSKTTSTNSTYYCNGEEWVTTKPDSCQ